jgi:hypothetical protein
MEVSPPRVERNTASSRFAASWRKRASSRQIGVGKQHRARSRQLLLDPLAPTPRGLRLRLCRWPSRAHAVAPIPNADGDSLGVDEINHVIQVLKKLAEEKSLKTKPKRDPRPHCSAAGAMGQARPG